MTSSASPGAMAQVFVYPSIFFIRPTPVSLANHSCQALPCHCFPAHSKNFPNTLIVVGKYTVIEELHRSPAFRRHFRQHPFAASPGANQNVPIGHGHEAQSIHNKSELRTIRSVGIISKLFNEVGSRRIDFIHRAILYGPVPKSRTGSGYSPTTTRFRGSVDKTSRPASVINMLST